MPAPRISQLQAQLRRTIRALDAEISATPLDSKLQRALTRMYSHREDELGRLLAEVGQKAGLLDTARLRAAYLHRYAEPGAGAVYAAEIHRTLSQAPPEDGFTRLDVDLPQPARHGDMSIGVTALAESSGRYHLRLQLTSETPFAGTMPLLAGVRVTDQTGRVYPVENGQETQSSEGATWRLTGTLSFTPDPGAPLATINLAIGSVLFAERHAFLATEAPARLVEGPWEFSITVPQAR